jgi:hypothetical protein
MSHGGFGSDSFSAQDDNQDSHLESSKKVVPKMKANRGGSPIFGSGNHKKEDIFIDSNVSHSIKQSKYTDNQEFDTETNELRMINDNLTRGQDKTSNIKGHMGQLEGVFMMAKYQLAMLKTEASVLRISNSLKHRNFANMASGFATIRNFNKNQVIAVQYKSRIVYEKFRGKMEVLVRSLQRLTRKQEIKGFNNLVLNAKSTRFERKIKEEREKFNEKISESNQLKDKDITQLAQKVDECNTIILKAKARESDLISKLKSQDKQIQVLEQEKSELAKKKSGPVADSNEIRYLQNKIRELQAENDEMKEKVVYTESHVGSFIKDMSDLLESHDLSTNVGSYDTGSLGNLHNPNFDLDMNDELDFIPRMKEKPSYDPKSKNGSQSMKQGGASAYDNMKPGSQTNINRSSNPTQNQNQNRMSKNIQHINYCVGTIYDDPLLNIPNSNYRRILANKNLSNEEVHTDEKKQIANALQLCNNLNENSVAIVYEPIKLKEKTEEKPVVVKQITWNKNSNGITPKILEAPMQNGKNNDSSASLIGKGAEKLEDLLFSRKSNEDEKESDDEEETGDKDDKKGGEDPDGDAQETSNL